MRRLLVVYGTALAAALLVAFLVPLGLLASSLAHDRAVETARQEAQGLTVLANTASRSQLRDAVDAREHRPAPDDRLPAQRGHAGSPHATDPERRAGCAGPRVHGHHRGRSRAVAPGRRCRRGGRDPHLRPGTPCSTRGFTAPG